MATGTNCPACTAVATGGRIRINEDDADLLEEMLHDRRQAQLIVRRAAIDDPMPGVVALANGVIRQIDRISAEIERTREEKGWRTGHEPERPDS
jgi:hypothetical protein